MHKNRKLIVKILHGHAAEQTPVWLMRQAGRYLPEYMELRDRAGSFMGLCLNSGMAAEATLQPVRRFGVDGAIIFSDILMVPYALGQKVEFVEGVGPLLEPVDNEKKIRDLFFDVKKVEPVFEAVRLAKAQLPDNVAMIGFCGGLWTVACYMIEGSSKDGFKRALAFAEHQPEFMQCIIETLYDASLEYLCKQIDAGAEVIQIFDSWAGLLQADKFRKLVIEPTRRLVKALEDRYPEIPVIGFPRGATPADYKAYVMETGVDALSVDQDIPLNFIRDELQSEKPVQGNMDPEVLVVGGEKMEAAINHIMENLGPNHIFNLGHGVLPETPPENVAALVEQVKEFVIEK